MYIGARFFFNLAHRLKVTHIQTRSGAISPSQQVTRGDNKYILIRLYTQEKEPKKKGILRNVLHS